jgi:8-oxo-dGTP diphosphatase
MTDYIQWLRSKVGHLKVILPYSTAIIYDEQGRILLQRRSDFGDAWWGLPGGILELGENFEQCVVREVQEETGLQVEVRRFIGIYTSPDFDVHYPNGDLAQQFCATYACKIVGGVEQADGHETLENRFFSIDEIASLTLPPWYALMMQHFSEFMQGQRNTPYFDPPYSPDCDGNWWMTLRQLTGPERLITVGAGAVIQNEAGQVLLTLRREGLWGIPAGLMDLGETSAGTLVREAKEEMNAEIAIRDLVGVFTGPESYHTYPDGNQVQIVSVLFRADLLNTDLTPDGDETRDLRWFDPNTLPEMVHRHYKLVEAALAVKA